LTVLEYPSHSLVDLGLQTCLLGFQINESNINRHGHNQPSCNVKHIVFRFAVRLLHAWIDQTLVANGKSAGSHHRKTSPLLPKLNSAHSSSEALCFTLAILLEL
jgi:hypothetical protein